MFSLCKMGRNALKYLVVYRNLLANGSFILLAELLQENLFCEKQKVGIIANWLRMN